MSGLLFIAVLEGRAEQLPVRTYSTADGLPRDTVTRIKQDSRGFIWMMTGEGISRFDGYKFTNYTTDDGLPDRRVNDLLETRDGIYWMATEGGVCRFNPRGSRLPHADPGVQTTVPIRNPQSIIGNSDEPMFVTYPLEGHGQATIFNVLLEDATGAIWCGTSEGLYRLDMSEDKAQFQFVDLGLTSKSAAERNVLAMLEDRTGAMWIGTEGGALYRRWSDGRVECYTNLNGLPPRSITSLLADRDGQIWVGTRGGLCRLVAEADPSRLIVARTYGREDGLASAWIFALYQSRDGKLWVATSAGLCVYSPANETNAPSFQTYNSKNGLCDADVFDVSEDRNNNLWVASRCSAAKVARNGFTGYGLVEGFKSFSVNSIFENRDGALFVINSAEERANRQSGYIGRIINRFDGARFTAVEPDLPSDVTYHGWGWGQTIIQDHTGEWWVPAVGLYRFPRVDRIEELARARPQLVRTLASESNRPEIFRLYEDARGDVWIATTGLHNSLLRWERTTNSVHDHTPETGVPSNTDFTSFIEDRAGNLWIGTSEGGGLLRYSAGKFKRYTVADGVPPGWIISLYADRVGRLWIASSLGGLNRTDDPAADTLHVVRYTTLDGLSSNNIRAITEDQSGHVYIGTGHGIDRLDPETGNVKHYTAADGLPKGRIEIAYRDRSGTLWFGSTFGVARFMPEQNELPATPTVYLSGLRVAGIAQRISELGETTLPQLELAASQNQVSIEFVGLGVSVGEELHYQYYLAGAEDNWSAPTTARTVNYANLAPGAYRFLVRAISADGQVSRAPASISFTILAPVWRRWWFLALVVLVIGTSVYALYRYRVRRLLEVADIRTRIATDLHDDIGANLTKIAILSEVAKQQSGNGHDRSDHPLSSIARISRESVEAMSDIVWTINPQRDSLLDLTRRMRQYAEEIFVLRDIKLDFRAEGVEPQVKLSMDVRRDLFLIFKEAVNNTIRHSHCTRVGIDFDMDSPWLSLQILDDGIGFAPDIVTQGQGLMSMRRRAQTLGGTLTLESRPGHGTIVKFKIPCGSTRRIPARRGV